jgi:alpha-glucosidase
MSAESASRVLDRVRFRGTPAAHPDSMVVSGKARFTILTPRLLRLEWSETGVFEDRASYAFPTRHGPVPFYRVRQKDRRLEISTSHLILCYIQNSGRFGADNLAITFHLGGKGQAWRPGMPNPQNLRGTRRTLDNCAGDSALDEGPLSRAGWSLFDDSHSVLFDPADGWVASRAGHEAQDWYFFGYGHDYKGALAEYTRFGGAIPLVPRYTLGAWWSRYWEYSDRELKDLVRSFEEHNLPLDVLVIDMDWHTPHSWTGYTWNREFFPDPPAFLRWVHEKGLRATLNLHPAEGVQAFEEVYARFATAMGTDPATHQAVPFRISDKRFVQCYFELLHHPLEDDGVDFWWVDWQQGEVSELEGLDPLPWLNHLHFSDSRRRGLRPVIYSRWGGLGSHRYPLGFSGDTWVGWSTLQFQPRFTATASNVAYGWWGHDIGGHMGGATEPELFARWVQYGALSPVLRLHATKDPLAERRPWKYPVDVLKAARQAFSLRYRLLPYIYTMARVAHDTGISLCRPMYYEYPEEEAAYAARYQYFFGNQMIAAPLVHPADPRTGLAATDVWVPEGTWIDPTTREIFTGPRWVRLLGGLDRVPMLMKAGAILPLAAPLAEQSPDRLASGTSDAIPNDPLILSVYPGCSGRFRLYEDDGLTEAYKDGDCEWTEITSSMADPRTWSVEIEPVEGRCDALPRQRAYKVRLEGSQRPDRVLLEGKITLDWEYDPATLTTSISVPPRDRGEPVSIVAHAPNGLSALGEEHNRRLLRYDVERLLGDRLPEADDDSSLLDAVLTTRGPGRSDAVARLGGPFVRVVEFTTPEEARRHLGRLIVGAPAWRHEPFDLEVTWTVFRSVGTEKHTLQIETETESQILDAPFAFDGEVQTMFWTVEASLRWRGATLTHAYQSNLLFPSIHTWHTIVYDQAEHPLPLEQVMDTQGNLNGNLSWRTLTQARETIGNVNEPHSIHFSEEHKDALLAGASLAAYMSTTIISRESRDAVLHFRSASPTEIHLNGRKVEEAPVDQEAWLPGLPRRGRRTATMRLHAGRNSLLIHTEPPRAKRPLWYFQGTLATVNGEPISGLILE